MWDYHSDIASLITSAVLLTLYNIYLRWRTRKHPEYTIQALNRVARTAWVDYIMSDSAQGVLAIQTLRNSTMAATFLASTATLLIIGTLTLSGDGDKLNAIWHSLNIFGATDTQLWAVKLLFLVVDFLVAFFNFSMAIRYFNHVGYMINVPKDRRGTKLTPSKVAAHLNNAGRFYSIGMRAYYTSVPLVFWLFGPHFMLIATIGLIIVLYHLDRVK